jgi:hypothetical protein
VAVTTPAEQSRVEASRDESKAKKQNKTKQNTKNDAKQK